MNIKIEHLRSFTAIYFCCLAVSCVPAPGQVKSSELAEELLFLRYDAGMFARVQAAELLIQSDGSAIITLEWRHRQSEKARFHLGPEEMEALKTLIHATDLFSQPQGQVAYTDLGVCTLRSCMNDKRHELRYDRNWRPLEPLTQFALSLIHQSIAVSDLEHKRDAYWTLGKVKPYDRGGRWPTVLQPQVLREPAQKYVASSNDRQQILWAIEALSWITTPEEWTGFLALEVQRSQDSRRSLLLEALSSHPFTGNIPKAHCEMLCPLFLRYLRLEYRNWSQFAKEKRQAYGSVIRFLCAQRHTPSIPILVEMVQLCYTDYDSWLGSSLPHMAGEAIEPLTLLLDSPKATIRAGAAEMLGKILTINPSLPSNTIPQRERDRILKCLRSTVVPQLQRLSNDDPDSSVRQAAEHSLQQIERGWNK